jgi:5S rRNA maturation endonuclease (ribonuclease M5)
LPPAPPEYYNNLPPAPPEYHNNLPPIQPQSVSTPVSAVSQKTEKSESPIAKWRNYNYTNEQGEVAYKKAIAIKENGEKFAVWKRKDVQTGEFIKGLNNEKPPLFHVQNLQNNSKIYIVEGEKDVFTMEKMGLSAVCSPHGSKWSVDYSLKFIGKDVIVITDNDKSGCEYGQKINETVPQYARSFMIIPAERLISDIQKGGDISDVVAILGDKDTRMLLERNEQVLGRTGGGLFADVNRQREQVKGNEERSER